MNAVEHAVLTVLMWVLTGYAVACAVIFACLMVMASAALLGWPWEPRRRMPTDREWERTLAAWTRETEKNQKERRDV